MFVWLLELNASAVRDHIEDWFSLLGVNASAVRQGHIEVWFSLLGLNASATGRVISRIGLVC